MRSMFPDSETNVFHILNLKKRICPGRYLADNTLYIAACSILQVFNLSNAKDSNGVDIPINVTSTSGAISYVQFWFSLLRLSLSSVCSRSPYPFECSITPRIKSAEVLLERYQELYRDESQ